MTRPAGFLIRMAVFLAAVAVVAYLLRDALLAAFEGNPVLNAVILSVLLIGIAWNFVQVARLAPEVTWLETFRQARARLAALPSPKLLASMASLLAARENRGGRAVLSPAAMRSMLDGIGARLDESREVSRYMTGLLIFLGLLGTFWGLLQTVHAVADVIGGMSVGGSDATVVFERLKAGLAQPLRGMSTAFSASMFGLAGALVLGFLDLTAGQAQNRFYNELEEWLSGITRLGSGLADGEASMPVYIQALLEQTAENLEALQGTVTRGEESRAATNAALVALTERLSALADTVRGQQTLMLRAAEAQQALAPVLTRMADAEGFSRLEAVLGKMLAELESARGHAAELRTELRVLTRTVAALAEDR